MTANPIQVTKRENYGEPHIQKEVLFSSRHILADSVRFLLPISVFYSAKVKTLTFPNSSVMCSPW